MSLIYNLDVNLMSGRKNKTLDSFRLEEYRSELAEAKNYSELKKTYSSHLQEIKDLNTPKLWDNLNFEHFNIKNQNPMMWDRINTVARLIPRSIKKVLDIGFGGAQLEDLVGTSYDWHGLDISPKSVKSASKRHPNKHFQIGQITALNFPKLYFDCVIALELLEHIPPHSTFKALSQVHDVLKPDGYFIVSVPLNEDLEHTASNPNAHVRVYTPALIQAELHIAGFKIISTEFLYAFHKYYPAKKVLTQLFPFLKQPNIIIILARKS